MRRLSPSANSRRLRRSSRPFTALVRGVETLEPRQLLAASPAGSEFMVNTTTAENQQVFAEQGGATAMDPDGDFVVVWSSFLQDGSGYGVYAQRYNRAGLAQGGEFLVNTTTENNQKFAAVAMDADGDFVVTWQSNGQDGGAYGVYAQRYNAAGAVQGGEFLVNTTTANQQIASKVAMDADGDFVVTWSSNGQDGGGYGVYAQRYNAAGAVQGGEFRVNTTTANHQYGSTVAMDANGNFVVTWASTGQDNGSSQGVYAQRYNAAGVTQGGEFLVNTTTVSDQTLPTVAMDADGDFVVTWTSLDGSSAGVYAQRYNAAGATQGGEFLVNTTTANDQSLSTVAMDSDGDFVVTWTSNGQDGGGFGVYAQQFNAAGVTDGGEFLVNTTTAFNQFYSSVAMDADGDFVVTWTGYLQMGGNTDVYAQRYAVPVLPTVVVTTATDIVNPLDGLTSLREAINFSNSNAGLDTIGFNIAGAGVQTISLLSALPTITEAVTIDGTTQTGFVDTPLIELDGTLAGAGANGLLIISGDSTVKGLAINRFAASGIHLQGLGSNIIQGNFIGTNTAGTADLGNGLHGIYNLNTPGNLIGGTAAGTANVISGNNQHGVLIQGGINSANVVQGNFIGTNAAGTAALGNTLSGIQILHSSVNTIGGLTVAGRNVISGNGANGVHLMGAGTSGTLLRGNYLGTDVNGTADLGNSLSGVQIDNGAASNTIGGTTAAARNIISGNNQYGVRLQGYGVTTLNNVQGNYIGTNASGSAAIGNSLSGVQISATSNTIGGGVAGAGNLISGNVQHGVLIQGGINVTNLVQGNLIGTSANGTADLGNTQSGVQVLNSSGNTIGGTTVLARNVISGNNENGIHLLGSGTTTTVVQGNYIGTRVLGDSDLGNTQNGVLVNAASNTIGGTAAGARNIISGNDRFGILIQGVAATGNNVQGNFVGINAVGALALGNSFSGVMLYDAGSNTIGGTTASARNVISGNLQHGVCLSQVGATNNVVQGNYIGMGQNGTSDRGNTLNGVQLDSGASSNTIGGTSAGARNIISGNDQNGIHLLGFGGVGVGTRNNLIQGNYIGVDVSGINDGRNTLNGVLVQATANTIGGTVAGAGNVISGNNLNGVLLQGGVNAATLVQRNFIGTQSNGVSARANSLNGVLIVNSSGNTIGGTTAGSGNTIAFNLQDGVAVLGADASTSNNAISGNNSIFSNLGSGIDLNANGLTANDVDDPDAGPNHLQNFPVFSSVKVEGPNLDITYSVPSLPANSAFPLRIEFFIADANNQEGKTFLGFDSYTTTGAKSVTFSAGAVVVGSRIVATATDANGNTSEFSLSAPVV